MNLINYKKSNHNNFLRYTSYNDEKSLRKLLIEIGNLYQSSFDILIINDGSDQELYFSKKNKSLKIINMNYL